MIVTQEVFDPDRYFLHQKDDHPFSSNASSLGAPAGNVLMRNWQTGQTRVLSSQSGSSVGAVAMSRTGAYVVFGAGTPLDPRFATTGLFARFTGVGRGSAWLD